MILTVRRLLLKPVPYGDGDVCSHILGLMIDLQMVCKFKFVCYGRNTFFLVLYVPWFNFGSPQTETENLVLGYI